MAEFMLGMHAKLYYGALALDGTNQAAWLAVPPTEVTNVRDLTLSLETGEADITTRANDGWRATAATLKTASVEFEMLWKTTDAVFTAVKAAWLAGSEIAFFVTDGGLTAGYQGLLANFVVTTISRSEPLEDAVKYSVTIKPSSHMEWKVIAA